MGWTSGIRVLAGTRNVLTPQRQNPVLMPIRPSVRNLRLVVSPAVKWAKREADHLPPNTAQEKTGGAISPLSYTPSWRGA
jgi:hypothetical protein